MAKKKKTQTQEGLEAPQKDTVFPETGVAQGATAANQVTIPDDVAELIRATLKVAIAQRKVYGLSTTLTSLTKTVVKALDRYVDGIPTGAIRDFIKREVTAMGYPVIEAKVDYSGVPFIAETVLLYRNFEEIVDMVKAGRLDTLRPVIVGDGIDPIYDKTVKGKDHA